MLLNDLSSKIENLCDFLRLKEDSIKKRNKISQKIQKSLKSYYPDCQILIYGSTLNGFGTENSDLDLLFLPYPNYPAENSIKADSKTNMQKSPTLDEINTGAVSKEELLHLDRQMQLSFLHQVLRKDSSFQKVVLIPARCPIIQFFIPQLKITSDISCGNSSVVTNSKLLKFYKELDDRLQPLVITLRHWAKSVLFQRTKTFSSYAFTLLIIFFLQNTKPQVLPTVKYLQELSETFELEDGWNVAFSTDFNKVMKSKNTKSIGELFKEFFVFYAEFDFLNFIVCPYSGQSLPVKDISETCDKRLKEFKISALCIQDPFVHSFNTSRNVDFDLLNFFIQAVSIATDIIDKSTIDCFESLFDKKKHVTLCIEKFCPLIDEKARFFIVNLNFLKYSFDNAITSKIFYDIACKSVLELLNTGLLIDCEVIDLEINLKPENKKRNSKFLMCIQCALYDRTYINREKFPKGSIPPIKCDLEEISDATIKNEYIISNFVIQENALLSSPEPFFWFYCDIYLNFCGILQNFIFVITPLTFSQDFKIAFNFLRAFITKNLPIVLSNSEELKSFLKTNLSNTKL